MRRKILKKKFKTLCKMLVGGMAFFSSMFINPPSSKALPVEPVNINRVNINNITSADGVMNIVGTGNAFINWRDFSVFPRETLNFSGMTNMLNYVSSVNPSLIYGNINAPDVKDFYVINPNGVLFGPNSRVITGDLYVSTRSLTNDEINAYISNGTNPLKTPLSLLDTSRINNGGVKSSDIMGIYDIADGDVMFLGKVQADSLTIEGNVIQIRNTANIMNKDGTEKLTDVTLISNNPVEVGYEVSTDGVNLTADNPFGFGFDAQDEESKAALIARYNLYQYNNETTVDLDNRTAYHNANVDSVKNLFDFVTANVDTNASDNDKIIAAMALDKIIRDNIVYQEVQGYDYDETDKAMDWTSYVQVLNFPASTDEKYSSMVTAFESAVSTIKTDYGNMLSDPYSKYYLADMIGDKNMSNSANRLGYTAKKLDQTESQTIEDYRLIQSIDDFTAVNQSKYYASNNYSSLGDLLTPTEGKVHGNYMLNQDFDLSNVTFNPLAYNMNYEDYYDSDFKSKDDLIKFNGLNFTISGLKTNTDGFNSQGLFAVFAGTIKNLRLNDTNIDTTASTTGGLIGSVVAGSGETLETKIKNVSVNGKVSGQDNVGGLVGNVVYFRDDSIPAGGEESNYDAYDLETTTTLTLENVDNFAEISSTTDNNSYVGGLVGKVDGTLTAINSMNSGKITGGEHAGGLVGANYEFSPTTFNKVANIGNVTASSYAGGLIGYSYEQTTITNSYNTGNIGDENTAYAGGIANFQLKTADKVFNSGNIMAKSYAAGLVAARSEGPNKTTIANLSNSYNSGNVTATNGSAYGITFAIARPKSTNYDYDDEGNEIITEITPSPTNNVYNTGDITGNNIDNSHYVAGLAKTINGDAFNIYNLGKITNNGELGFTAGVVGQIEGNVTNALNAGNVTGNTGKVTGRAIVDNNNTNYLVGVASDIKGNASNIYNFGNITNNGELGFTAGVVGQIDGTLNNALNAGNVTSTSSKFTVGVVNSMKNSATNIYNFGNITAEDENASASGLFGTLNHANANFKNLYNFGTVTGGKATGIAHTNSNTATFSNVYNFGDVNATNGYASGILYKPSAATTFDKVYNFGSITSTKDLAAGILGYVNTSISIDFTDVYNTGKIEGTSAAGIINYARGSNTSSSPGVTMTNVHNFGDITATSTYAAGIGGDIYAYKNTIWKNVSNQGTITGNTFASGIAYSRRTSSKNTTQVFQNVYNFGDVTASNGVAAGLISTFDVNNSNYYPVLGDVYNGGTITGTTTYDIQPTENTKAVNVLTEAPEATTEPTVSIEVDEKIFVATEKNTYYTYTDEDNVTHLLYNHTTADAPLIDFEKVMSDIWAAFGADLDGSQVLDAAGNERTDTTWRVYANPNNPFDKNRQPLLTQWMHPAEVTRYSQLKEDGSVDVSWLINPTFGMHGVHNSRGRAIMVRYKNSGQSSIINDDEGYYYTLNPNFFGYTISESADGETFSVAKDGVDLAEAFLYGTQFGYNFHFTNNTDAWSDDDEGTSSSGDLVSDTPLTSPANNAVYLRIGGSDNVPTEPKTKQPIDVTPSGTPSEIDPDDDSTTINFAVIASSGQYNKDTSNVTYSYTDADGNHYRVSNPTNADISAFTLAYEELEVDDGEGNISHYTTTVKITYDGTEYSIDKGNLTYDSATGNYTLTVKNEETNTTYNITITPGAITSTDTMDVVITVGDGTIDKDNNFTDTSYSANNSVINSLIADVFEVVNTDNTTTTLRFKDGTTLSEGENTYKGYTITKNGDTYTYVDTSDEYNTIIYNVTVVNGAITIYQEVNTSINVHDGTITDGTFASDGYDIVGGDDVVNSRLSNLNVIQSGDNTTVRLNVGANLSYDSEKDSYVYKTTSGNTITTYFIKVNPGNIITTNHATVTIDVADGEIIDDGALTIIKDNGNDYTVDDEKISGLLADVLEVVSDGNGKTTLQIKDSFNHTSTKDSDTTTYKVTKDGVQYTFTKTGDTFTYTDNSDSKNIMIYNVTLNPGDITTYKHKTATVELVDGRIADDTLTLQSVGGKDYSVTGTGAEAISTLLTGVLTVEKNSDGTATTVKIKDSVEHEATQNLDGTTTYNVTKGGTEYEFTKNLDGTFTYYDRSDASNILIYNVTVDPGNLTYEVNLQVGDITTTDNVITTEGDYTITNDNGNIISELLSGKLSVVENVDGLGTTLVAKNSSALTNDGNGNYTYTDGGKTYNFTRAGNVYTYTDEASGVTYEVKVAQGELHKIYNIDIEVNGGVFYIDENGNGSLSWNTTSDSYNITKNADNSKFTDNFNVSYNSPADSKFGGAYETTVSVKNKSTNEDYTTGNYDGVNGGYNQLTLNADGYYTLAPITSGNIQYNIKIKPGEIISDQKVPVVINVANGKLIDGTDFEDGGYSVTNTNIGNLLKDKLEVVRDGENTTVQFKDGTTLTEGERTYTFDGKDYVIEKSGDKYTYKVENSEGEIIEYVVTIAPGNISYENNEAVELKVNNGVITDGAFTGDGYTVDNSFIEGLLDGNLKVITTNSDKNTTIAVNNADNLSNTNGNLSYRAADGKIYNFTKTADNKYSYSITEGNTTTKYNVTVIDGDINVINSTPVTVKANDGKVIDGEFQDNGYSVTNTYIKNLLTDKLEVIRDGDHTKVQFKDGTTLTDGEHTYTFDGNDYVITKDGDTYTYKVENGNDVKIYKITVEQGDISIENNNEVKLTVNDGTLTDGTFAGNGYSVDNEFIGGLLNGNLQVMPTTNNKNTTVTVRNAGNLTTNNDTLTYRAADGKTYEFTKTANNQYLYSITEGSTTTNYKVTVIEGDITATNNISVNIDVNGGRIKDGILTVTNSGGKEYSVDNAVIGVLLKDVLTVEKNSDGTATTIKIKDGINHDKTTNSDGTITHTVTKGGTTYTFTENDGAFTYVDRTDPKNILVYNVTVDPGSLTYEVNLKVGDITTTDNVVTSSGDYTITSDNGSIINNLLSGKLSVIATSDGLHTTLSARNSSALTDNGNGNYTYRDANNIYNFTKSGNVYTYKDTTSGITYEVTVQQGDLHKIYNINIEVSDGVFYINESGNGNLVLTTPSGYRITKNADNSNFTESFDVSYNAPDESKVTGVYATTVSVKNKSTSEDYTTSDFGIQTGGYNQLTANADGTYTLAPIINGNVQYNITIKPGEVISDTRIPVVIKVNDGKVTDGTFTDNGYSVNNPDIENLLQDKLIVVKVDGKTTVQFKDGTTLTDGEHTYTFDGKDYTITKDGDTYTYKVTNPNEEIIEYTVRIDTGNISNENNNNVLVKVNNGIVIDGNFTGNGYSVDNEFIGGLLEGNLKVIQSGDKTTVTVNDSNSLTNTDGKLIYHAADGKIYNFTKTSDNTYLYTITNGDTTTNYNVTVIDGDIITRNSIPVTITVNDGKLVDGTFTDNGYSVNNPDIENLLQDKLIVINVDGKTTVQFKDGTTLADGEHTYTFDGKDYTITKNSDGTFTYKVTTDDDVQTYTISVNPGDISKENNNIVTVKVNDGTLIDGNFTGNGYSVDNEFIGGLLEGNLQVINAGNNKTTVKVKNGDNLSDIDGNLTYKAEDGKTYSFTKTADNQYLYTITEGDTTTNYTVNIVDGNISTTNNIPVTINVRDGKISDGTFTDNGYSVTNPDIERILKDKLIVINVDGKTTVKFKDDVLDKIITNPDGSQTYTDDTNTYTFTKNTDDTYTYRIINPNGETLIYTVSINSGNTTTYLNTPVTLNVGDGILKDGKFTNDGYTVDNDVIGGLLEGTLTVYYNTGSRKTTVDFSDRGKLSINGKNYSYVKGSKRYSFTKNTDGTFEFVLEDGHTITTYTITVNPGLLSIENSAPSLASEPDPTPSPSPAPTSTPTTSPTTPSNTTTPTTNSTTPTPDIAPEPITTTPTYTTPITDDFSTTISTPPTVIDEPEPTPTPVIDEPEPTPTPVIDEPEPTPTPTPLIDEPEPIPTPTPLIDEPEPTPTQLINEPEPAPTTETATPAEELESPDYELRNSKIEEFPEEKGDYIDLDAQDHILIETTDTNEEIDKLEVIPEEFSEATDRNVVNGKSELTSITDSDQSTRTPDSPTNDTELNSITDDKLTPQPDADNNELPDDSESWQPIDDSELTTDTSDSDEDKDDDEAESEE